MHRWMPPRAFLQAHRLERLSRRQGNFHARFAGEGLTATSLPNPTVPRGGRLSGHGFSEDRMCLDVQVEVDAFTFFFRVFVVEKLFQRPPSFSLARLAPWLACRV